MEIAVGGLTIAPLAVLIALLAFSVHLFFAIGVSSHAKQYARNHSVWFVGRMMWFIATLLGGVPIAAIYWALHCSTLNRIATGDE